MKIEFITTLGVGITLKAVYSEGLRKGGRAAAPCAGSRGAASYDRCFSYHCTAQNNGVCVKYRPTPVR